MKQGKYIIADAGRMFKYSNTISFKLPEDVESYDLLLIDTDNIQIKSNYAFIDNKFAVEIGEPLKGKLINKIFSNDDELAIMLNYQNSKTTENKEKLNCLQSWRNWFGELAKKIEEKYKECYDK